MADDDDHKLLGGVSVA